jgi:hypothetical protein
MIADAKDLPGLLSSMFAARLIVRVLGTSVRLLLLVIRSRADATAADDAPVRVTRFAVPRHVDAFLATVVAVALQPTLAVSVPAAFATQACERTGAAPASLATSQPVLARGASRVRGALRTLADRDTARLATAL